MATTQPGPGAGGPGRPRMRSPQRRAQLIDAAALEFAEHGYHGATMVGVARAAGVTAALAYRHFPSKSALFVACVEHEWQRLRDRWDAALALDPPPDQRLMTLGLSFVSGGDGVATLAALWFQAIAEAPRDDAIRACFVRSLEEVHVYVADTSLTSQHVPGGMLPEREASVESWTFVALGFLMAADMRTGGQVVGHLPAINRERMSWLYGEERSVGFFGPR
ncbi:MAG: TetR family transcriptional regulator [Thermoleophilia bacterium]|nr:TetR family transcriptional regulator [Thermoleophilia bacterium]